MIMSVAPMDKSFQTCFLRNEAQRFDQQQHSTNSSKTFVVQTGQKKPLQSNSIVM